MPFVVGALVAGAVVGTSITAGGVVYVFSMTAFGMAMVLGGLSYAMQQQAAGKQSSGGPGSRQVNVRQADMPQQIVLGEVRTGGLLSYMRLSRFDNLDAELGYTLDESGAIVHDGSGPLGQVVGISGGAYQSLIQTRARLCNFHIVLTAAGHEVESFEGVYLGEELLTLDANGYCTAPAKYAGAVRVKFSLGGEADGVQPFADLVAETAGYAGPWTEKHRQTGHAKAYLRLTRWGFPGGLPEIRVLVRGVKALDNRTDTTAYTTNSALLANWYLTDGRFGLGAVQADEIDDDDLTESANICEEAVAVVQGGADDRYECNGVFSSAERPQDILAGILNTMAGKAVHVGAKWRIHAGAYYAPTVTLDEGDLRGELSVQPQISKRDSCNGVKGTCTFPSRGWQPADFAPVTSATYLAQDDGEENFKDLDLTQFCTSHRLARRLAKIELLRTRQPFTINATFGLKAFGVVAGRTVAITHAQHGFDEKPFEVMASRFVVTQDKTLAVELALRETAEDVFEWSTDEESSVDAAPNSQLPTAGEVGAPGAPAIAEDNYETRDGNAIQTRATLTWDGGDYAYARMYQVEHRPVTSPETAWTVLPLIREAGGGEPKAEILDLTPGRYDFRVKVVTYLGAESEYASSLNVEILGLGDRPAALTGVKIQKLGGLAVLTWDLHPAGDVRRGGRILTRHVEPGISQTWENAVSIGDPQGVDGHLVMAVLPLKAGTYILRVQDAIGTLAETVNSVTSDGATAIEFSTLGSVQEDPTFAGTHSNTVSIDSVLQLTGAGLFDDIPDLDALEDPIDVYGGINASGTYTFSAGIDLGTATRVRVVGTIEAVTVAVGELFDSRTDNVDDWLDFDGAAGGGHGDCYLEVRATDDDPAGAPSWSDWQRLDASEYNARAFQARARLSVNDPSYNERVTKLRLAAQEIV